MLVPIKLWVYGTLKSGFYNNALLTGTYGDQPAKFIGKAATALSYPMMVRRVPFPYLFDVPGKGTRCLGEVYEVTDINMLRRLDRLEGVPNHYRRKQIKVILDVSQEESEVFAYFINRAFEDDFLRCCGSNFEANT